MSASLTHGVELITDQEGLRAALERLAQRSQLAVDSEADGMFRYRARLCTLQIGAGDEIFVLDTLALGAGVRALEPILSHAAPTKIFHDVYLDASLLRAAGLGLEGVFDTSVAARFLGAPATGLGSLLEAHLGISIDKSHQQADWGERPLSGDKLRYLREDVAHLSALADALRAQLRRLDIEGEVEEEIRYVLAQVQEPSAAAPPWTKLRGVAQLLPRQRALLSALSALREEVALELDIPAGRVLSGPQLLRLAELAAGDACLFERHLPGALLSALPRVRSARERALEAGEAPDDELRFLRVSEPPPAQIEARRVRRKLLGEVRAREAKRRGVDPQVVLPGHCLNDLSGSPRFDEATLRELRGFGEVRCERYARAWLAELGPRWPA